jgi:hypothetical protein
VWSCNVIDAISAHTADVCRSASGLRITKNPIQVTLCPLPDVEEDDASGATERLDRTEPDWERMGKAGTRVWGKCCGAGIGCRTGFLSVGLSAKGGTGGTGGGGEMMRGDGGGE